MPRILRRHPDNHHLLATAGNGALLGHLRNLSPSSVVLLVDNPARQGAIAAKLYFWRWRYRLQFELLISWSGKPPVALDSYHRYLLFRHSPRSFNKELTIFLTFKLALLIWVGSWAGLKLIPIMLAHGVVGEILYRWRDRRWRRRLAASPLGRRGTHDRGDRWHPFDEYLGLIEAPNLDTMARCTVPTEVTDYTYRTHTNGQGWRISAEPEKLQNGRVISVFGCSFTFGSGLNDEETYSWLLQNRFEDFTLRNYGIGASSAYQALLLIEKTILLDHPAAVVFGYQPTMDKRTIGRNSDAVARATMEHIFAQMRFTCAKHRVPFIVASLTAYNPHQAYLQSHGFSWCSVDFDEKETGDDQRYKWSLLPYDKHPNAAANREFCRVIGDALDKELRNERAVPEAGVLNRLAQLNKAPRKVEEFIYPHW